ncbi:hypothetical protein [Phytoactinopolyspora mesophila]|uniref:Uncharacterized protein n=1 Tax=Phytoactinopolyspora mesophila TaxID=2650750 RepID=A0A7K3M4Y1_9ACTN|nr:hypothetical protein [Phytoactinopolyspora mesophila]NDL58305.1 hypothetical protein [Phytoactinopolyspora mesophila]
MATLLTTLLIVVAATYVGYTMLVGEGTERDDNAPVSMTTWVDEAGDVCFAVAEEYPLLTQGSESRLDSDNLETVSAGVQTLNTRIQDLPPLTEDMAQDEVDAIVALGPPARDAWLSLEDDDDVSEDDLSDASTLTSAYVGGLVELGADCGVLD